MTQTIAEHPILSLQVRDSSCANFPLNSEIDIVWTCGKEKCKGWKCSPKIRNKYPDIVGCCFGKRNNCKNCNKFRSTFNYEEFKFPSYCGKCKRKYMVNKTARFCEDPTCRKVASFNFPNIKPPRFCGMHGKRLGMVDVTKEKRRCKYYLGCTKQPSYNLPGETQGKFRFEHREPGTINVVIKRCIYPNCQKYSSAYLLPSGEKGKFCSLHRESNIEVLRPNCKY